MRIVVRALLVAAVMSMAGSSLAYASSPSSYHVRVLEPLAGDLAYGTSITDNGLVTGTSSTDGVATHAVLWRKGRPRDLGALGGTEASSAVLWPVKDESGLVAGISQTDRIDPNNEDWSCGFFLPARPGFACVGFVWRDGKMRPLPTLGGPNGFAAGTNNRGQIVGWAENKVRDDSCTGKQVLQFRAVRWNAYTRHATELPPLRGDRVSAATAINDKGRVVGISGLCDQAVGRRSAEDAVVWDHGRPRRLPDLGGIAWDTPMSVNDRGDVVGFVNRSAADGTANRPVPVWWTAGGELRRLRVPDGFAFGQGLGINARRQVVGVAYSEDFQRCAAVTWTHDDRPVLLQETVAGSRLDFCSANDINDDGQITGQATDTTTGATVGFVATPRD